jgi:dihydrofolate synthase / folylpolyglutamate synthase
MDYQNTLTYLYNKLPMYQRIGGAAYKADLNNTIRLCGILGNPENKFSSVHVAGTNGKGSTSHLIASVFQQAGIKTGLYTSPHLHDFRERIRINGFMIPEEEVVGFVNKWKGQFEEIGLSFFEMTVGMAFDYFAREKVDIAVIEVGMGGRLDSTNVITPLVSVITNIGMDHMRFLGNSLQEIAREKAGIIKPGVPVVVGETQSAVEAVFRDKAGSVNAPVTFADQRWLVQQAEQHVVEIRYEGKLFLEDTFFPLDGSYQRQNLCTAMEAIRVFSEKTRRMFSKEVISGGIGDVVKCTGIKGRWQTIGTRPPVICDSGHNADGIRKVVENIRDIPYRNLHIVFGMVSDKSIDGILSLLPVEAFYYFCKPDIPRGMDAGSLAGEAQQFGLSGKVFENVNQALTAAKAAAAPDDLIFVGGSTFVVAEVV